jgi:chromosomal replication initiation ATPase DnaA
MIGNSITMQSCAEKVWTAARNLLRTLLNADIFNLWFASIEAVQIEEDTIVLKVANDFCELWLTDNYLSLIQDALTHAAGRQLKIKFQVAAPSAPHPASAKPTAEPAPIGGKEPDEVVERNFVSREVLFNPTF